MTNHTLGVQDKEPIHLLPVRSIACVSKSFSSVWPMSRFSWMLEEKHDDGIVHEHTSHSFCSNTWLSQSWARCQGILSDALMSLAIDEE